MSTDEKFWSFKAFAYLEPRDHPMARRRFVDVIKGVVFEVPRVTVHHLVRLYGIGSVAVSVWAPVYSKHLRLS